jgi:hypothetical protein
MVGDLAWRIIGRMVRMTIHTRGSHGCGQSISYIVWGNLEVLVWKIFLVWLDSS